MAAIFFAHKRTMRAAIKEHSDVLLTLRVRPPVRLRCNVLPCIDIRLKL